MASLLDLILVYKFVRQLTTPFEKWPAFASGVIDKNGNILVAKKDRTDDQKKSLTLFNTLIMNMKKTLAKLPGGSSKLMTYGAALYLIRESVTEVNEQDFLEFFKESLKNDELTKLMEDAPANATGAAVVGTGDDSSFAGAKVFKVNSDAMWKSRFGKKKYDKYKNYVGMDDVGEEIRGYARENPKQDIILKNERTGEMFFLRRKTPIM